MFENSARDVWVLKIGEVSINNRIKHRIKENSIAVISQRAHSFCAGIFPWGAHSKSS